MPRPWSWNARHVLHWCQSSTEDVTNHYSSSIYRPLYTAALVLCAYISTGLDLHRLLVLVGGILVHFLFHCDPPAGLFLQSDPAHHMFSSFSLPQSPPTRASYFHASCLDAHQHSTVSKGSKQFEGPPQAPLQMNQRSVWCEKHDPSVCMCGSSLAATQKRQNKGTTC